MGIIYALQKKRLSVAVSLSDSDSADGRSSCTSPWKHSDPLDKSRTYNSDERVVVVKVSVFKVVFGSLYSLRGV